MASYIRTSNTIKLLYRYYFSRFLGFENSGRYVFLQDCIFALAADPAIKKKTVEMIGEVKFKEYFDACFAHKDAYERLGDFADVIVKLAEKKEYLKIEQFINRKIIKASRDLPTIHRELLEFLILLVKDSDIEMTRIERSEILKPEVKMLGFDARRERFGVGEYREVQAKSGDAQ